MIKCIDWPIGVCTWSLGNDFNRISALRQQSRISHIHLAVSPAFGKNGENYLSRVRRESWNITATMIDFPQEDYSSLESIKATGGIVPDNWWADNRKRIIEAMDITSRLGVRYLTLHFGFLDYADDEYAKRFREKVKFLADAAASRQIMLLMETGQENAAELRLLLEDLNHPAIGVNFDPANMILYDKGNPIESVQILAPWIRHVHIKDALRTQTQGTWGMEVAWGGGQVGGTNFLKALEQINFSGTLAIERESGDSRFEDIKLAAERLILAAND